jgi:hypothetical protein
MRQFDELDLWNGRRQELIREAQDERRARSLRQALRANKRPARSGSAIRWLLWAGGHHAA